MKIASLMADYVKPGDDPSLFPDDGYEYAVVIMDTFKSPDDDDFIYRMGQFEDDDFPLPLPNQGETVYVHTSDGTVLTRKQWESENGTE